MKARSLLLLVLLLDVGAESSAQAQPTSPPEARSLRTRLATERADAHLATGLPDRVLLGVHRLGSLGTAAAAQRLAQAVEPGGSATSPHARLVALRYLAELDRFPAARRALSRAASGHLLASQKAPPTELDFLGQQTAALALARRGKATDIEVLARVLEGGSRASEAAAHALLAYPPADLGPLLSSRRAVTPALPRLLGALSDQRAFHRLRGMVRTGSTEVRAAAAVALTELGSYETIALARHWATRGEPLLLVAAAARILGLGGDPGAAAVTARLLDREPSREAGLALALEAPHPALVPALSSWLSSLPEGDASVPQILAAIGRAGGEAAARTLAAALTSPARAPAAAQALGRMVGPEAARELERALGARATRRVAVRGATLRMAVLGETVADFERALDALSRSLDAGDRAAAATGRALLDLDSVEVLLRSRQPVLRHAAGSALLLAGEGALTEAGHILEQARDPETVSALGVALIIKRVRDGISSRTLHGWLESNPSVSPLAALALAERDDPGSRASVDALLASGDPQIRAGAALGLGARASADATGRLDLAYETEASPEVRRCIVRALSRRPEPTRRRTLTLAATLDPDGETRALAKASLSGLSLGDLASGPGALLLPVAVGRAGGPAALGIAAGSGFLAPAWVAPDGVAIVFGLPAGPLDARVILLAPSESPH